MSIRKIKANNLAKIDVIDGATSTFLKEVERSLARLNVKVVVWTKDLSGGDRIQSNLRNISRAVTSRAQLEEMLLESGYRDATTKLMLAYDKVADLSMKGARLAGINDPFSQTDARAITASPIR